jgi:hypothetical protein
VSFCRRCFAPDFETLESYAHIRTQTLQDLANSAAHSWPGAVERSQKSSNTHDLEGAGYQESAAEPPHGHGPSGEGTFGPMTAEARARDHGSPEISNLCGPEISDLCGPTPHQSLINVWHTQNGPRRRHQRRRQAPWHPSQHPNNPATYTKPGNTPPPRSPQRRKPSNHKSARFRFS